VAGAGAGAPRADGRESDRKRTRSASVLIRVVLLDLASTRPRRARASVQEPLRS
jgi:hypothetical protein